MDAFIVKMALEVSRYAIQNGLKQSAFLRTVADALRKTADDLERMGVST